MQNNKSLFKKKGTLYCVTVSPTPEYLSSTFTLIKELLMPHGKLGENILFSNNSAYTYITVIKYPRRQKCNWPLLLSARLFPTVHLLLFCPICSYYHHHLCVISVLKVFTIYTFKTMGFPVKLQSFSDTSLKWIWPISLIFSSFIITIDWLTTKVKKKYEGSKVCSSAGGKLPRNNWDCFTYHVLSKVDTPIQSQVKLWAPV